jgi:hypothetical protein
MGAYNLVIFNLLWLISMTQQAGLFEFITTPHKEPRQPLNMTIFLNWRHDTQHNDIQYNDYQHNHKENATLSIKTDHCYAECHI